jgi:hypothetical protein
MGRCVAQACWALVLCVSISWPGAAQDACWPAGYSPQPTTMMPATPSGAGELHIYLDGSASMSGFVAQPKPGANAPWIMNAMIQSFPNLASAIGGKAVFYRAGDGRAADQAQVDRPLTDQQLREAVRPGWYNGKDAPLDVPLTQALQRPAQDVTIVVTDLFLSDAEMVGESFYTLKRPLDAALRAGKAIGILGIRHSFNGNIYDIPGRPEAYRDPSSRPLMFLMIGPPARIVAVKEKLDSEFLREQGDQSRFTLFTPKPHRGFRGIDAWGDRYLTSTDKIAPTRAFDESVTAVAIPKIELSSKAGSIEGKLDLSELWAKYALRPAEIRVESKMWLLQKPKSRRCEDRWDSEMEMQGAPVAAALGSGLEARLNVLPTDMREDVILGRYLIVSKLTVAGLSLEPVASWMSDWGFVPQDTEKLLAKKPQFFPALNLARLGRALRDGLNESISPVPIGEVAIAVQLKR